MPKNSHKSEFVVYVGPADGETDLEPMKIYRLAAREPSDPKNYPRVIDGSGEDYLYPQKLFELIDVPKRVEATLNADD